MKWTFVCFHWQTVGRLPARGDSGTGRVAEASLPFEGRREHWRGINVRGVPVAVGGRSADSGTGPAAEDLVFLKVKVPYSLSLKGESRGVA